MSRYADQIRDEFQRPVAGALVYVYDETLGTIEDLTADDASPLLNPVTTDAYGEFYFNADDGEKQLEVHFGGRVRWKELIRVGPIPTGPQGIAGDVAKVADRVALAAIVAPPAKTTRFLAEGGRAGLFAFDASNLAAAVAADTAQAIYVPPAADVTGASGAWVRKYSGGADARWFGAIADGVTDNYVALQAWLDFGGDLWLPFGEWYCSQRLQARKSMRVRGAGYGFDARIVGYDNMPGSRIRFPAGQGGLIAWTQTTNADTSDVVGNPGLYFTQEGAWYSTFEDFALIGANAGAAVTGFETRARVQVRNVHCLQFKGKGFDVQGTADIDDPSSDYGNVALTTLYACRAVECGLDGFNVRGRDSSVVLLNSCDAISNGGWGYLHNSFSGGTLVNCHAAANVLGGYKETSGIAATIYVGCYIEGGGGSNIDISYPCVVTGGNLSGIAAGVTNARTNGPYPTVIAGLASNFNQIKLGWAWDPPGVIADVCYVMRHASHGLWLQGHGTTFDLTYRNRNNLDVMQNPGATQNMVFAGDVKATQFTVGANKVVGAQGAAVADAAARTSANAVNAAAAPTQAEFNAFVAEFNKLRTDYEAGRVQLNLALARLRAATGHGLIA